MQSKCSLQIYEYAQFFLHIYAEVLQSISIWL